MNAYQALKVLDVDSNSSQEEIKSAFRKKALEHHPDKSKNKNEDVEFKRITEAYEFLKKNHHQRNDVYHQNDSKPKTNFKRKPWGAPEDEKIPEQDWGKYTKEFEEGDPDFWKEYEKKFWEEYNARVRPDGRNGEYEKAKEPKKQPNLFVDVDKSLCIGCCSCEIIAPDVFEINKERMMNPKSSVINQKGAGVNKIMDAAMTCPTKAIIVENTDTKERMYPY
ncbi:MULTISPECIES: ferredoxin [Nitrosopumilus]|uniref:Ferredoxin n=1 Tax=Nitrosopumilus piranensis TaxID=1582439 RepID=A0A0C5BRG4_9ARCH|nr:MULTISPECIES: ferredoxin [Nitrosopumilus]AJM92348.1 Heat shock protein DnaJ domain-containing protein [Nitrosopumilus piranensis]KAF6244278.1 molecular chaperone DnaJ [Nitrosopumilus sp. b2]